MKQITILYNPQLDNEQKKLAATLSAILKKNGYETNLLPIQSEADSDHFIRSLTPATCQLILSVNMAGYNLLSTDFSPALNHLMINIVNYITYPPEIFDMLLGLRMNFTMSFLFSSQENADYVKKHHPFLRNIFGTSSIEDYLPVYLEELDWRY